ncbi:hypothetical protein [Streptomyces sp. NPDC050856]|uniref:hypothetical protein n=1 Tax=Streptomyces sp. NPDC050856 TaxID=3154939 RepID=UPI0033F155FC
MARMRRGLVHAVAWSLATGAAVTLSWWGVHTVMAGTAYDPPRALPIAADRPSPHGPEPLASSTRRAKDPGATPSASPSRSAKPSRPAAPARSAPPAAPTRAPTRAPATAGDVRGYSVEGGRAVFDIGPSSAGLVSATPASGWRIQVWKQPTWIRVTFTRGGHEISVFCVWHDGAPHVEIDER